MNHPFNTISKLLPTLSTVESQKLALLLPELTLNVWQKNEYLYQEHKNFNHFIVLTSGLVRCFYIHKDTEVNLRFLCEESIVMPFADVASSWLKDSKSNHLKSHTNIQCISEVSGYCIPLHFFDSEIALIQKLKNELTIRHYLSMENRLRMLQLKNTNDRYEAFLKTMPNSIINNMPNFHIASYLGMSPETLSRIK